jgi:hypothetical protein
MTHTEEPVIRRTTFPNGGRRVELMQGDVSCSRIEQLVPFTIHIGKAMVRMDGISGLGTEAEFRYRGYASRVMEAAIETMTEGDAAIAMHYGIPDFYPRFGYATAGPEHYILLTEEADKYPLPEGWSIRPLTKEDLPTISRIYDQAIADSVGAAVRASNAWPWTRLADAVAGRNDDVCRVVVSPAGEVEGYAWYSGHFWYVPHCQRYFTPDAFVLCEVIAASHGAAYALLSACRHWAEEEAPGQAVTLPVPPTGFVAMAARQQTASFVRKYTRCGNSMARVLNVERLLRALLPELSARLAAAECTYSGTIVFDTDIGSAAIEITPESVTLADDARGSHTSIPLPQATLARLALGAYPPADLLDGLRCALPPRAYRTLVTLFPERSPHMYFPDRY